MLFSLALIFISSLILGSFMQKCGLPKLLGMLIVGIFLGPYALNLISPNILSISGEIRQAALVIILIRAGLSLTIQDLRKIGKPLIMMSFLPATMEMLAVLFFAPLFFGVSTIEAMVMGAVLAAVSPAILVPKMIQLIENGYGTDKSIPQLMMASASVNGVYVLVLFGTFLTTAQSGNFEVSMLIELPMSIIFGLLLGVLIGNLLTLLFQKIPIQATVKTLSVLCTSFLIVTLENMLLAILPLSGMLAIVVFSCVLLRKQEKTAKQLAKQLTKIWLPAEILLFVLIGATIHLSDLQSGGVLVMAFIFLLLVARNIGVLLSLLRSNLNQKERLFCCIAYLPKATVQAAIGTVPLMVGIPAGQIILSVSIWSILITASFGTIAINKLYKTCLHKMENGRPT